MKKAKVLIGLAAAACIATMGGTAQAACNDGKDRKVKIINDTATPLRELYGSNIGATTWQEDVLGSKVLGAGQTVTVNFDDGTCYCNYDFKAVFADKTETIRRGYNVCTDSSWRIHD